MEQAFEIRLDLRPVLRQLGEVRQMLEHLRQAEALAERLKDDRRRGRVCAIMTTVLSTLDELDEALVTGTRAVEIAQRARRLEAWHHHEELSRAGVLLPRRVRARGRDRPPRTSPLCQPNGPTNISVMAVPPSVFGRAWLVMSLAELGRFAEAAKYEAEAIQLAEPTQHAHTIGWAHLAASMLHLFKGDWAKARSLVENWINTCLGAETSPSLLPWAVASSAWALAQIGDVEEALSRVEEAEQLLERQAARGIFGIVAGPTTHWVAPVCCSDDSTRRGAWADRSVESSQRQPGFAAHALHLLGDLASHPDQFDAESGAAHYRAGAGARPIARHAPARRPLPSRPEQALSPHRQARAGPRESRPPRRRCTARWTWVSGSSRGG